MAKDVDEVVEYVQSSREVDDLNLIKKEITDRIEILEREAIKVGETAIIHFGERSIFKRFNGVKVEVIERRLGQYTVLIPDGKNKPIEHRIPFSMLTKKKKEDKS